MKEFVQSTSHIRVAASCGPPVPGGTGPRSPRWRVRGRARGRAARSGSCVSSEGRADAVSTLLSLFLFQESLLLTCSSALSCQLKRTWGQGGECVSGVPPSRALPVSHGRCLVTGRTLLPPSAVLSAASMQMAHSCAGTRGPSQPQPPASAGVELNVSGSESARGREPAPSPPRRPPGAAGQGGSPRGEGSPPAARGLRGPGARWPAAPHVAVRVVDGGPGLPGPRRGRRCPRPGEPHGEDVGNAGRVRAGLPCVALPRAGVPSPFQGLGNENVLLLLTGFNTRN